MIPKYPIYIISKGRSESRYTSKALDEMRCPYKIVIEPQEYELYAKHIDEQKIVTLPFSNLGLGSIPARNFVFEHSINDGYKKHWILDDNIKCFRWFNNNKRIKVIKPNIFKCAEDFIDRYKNVAMSGFQYTMFAVTGSQYTDNTVYKPKPFLINTRIYSCILIDNSIPFRWRGRYNEDTDLSLRCLKAGYCTVLFYAFLCDKQKTMTMNGGNSDELYKDDGRLKMAQSLLEQHPDCVKITKKWGRDQHTVDYSFFKKNKLIRDENVYFKKGIDNYDLI